ncbi:MAG: hypothetical protein NC933_02025, partial [Candidatus Omnitrophica bacterium]|nr:hypothetical protein [Candidatus Omnitrophota bacterium]
ESALSVSAFDLKKMGNKNAIAVCGRYLYIFSHRGNMLTKSDTPVFMKGTSRVRAARLSEEGYYDSIVASGETVKVFDRIGVHLSTINATAFLNEDLNGDGIDELIVDEGAYYTKDNGMSWRSMWTNDNIKRIQDIAAYGEGEGFCYNQYLGAVYSVSKDGKILFSSKPGYGIRCLAAGDFDGDGRKDDLACPLADGTVYIYEKEGELVNVVSMNLLGEKVDLNEAMTIAAGRLAESSECDDIVVGARRGLVVCSPKGKILWSYIKWAGENSAPPVYNLFLSDLDSDGVTEIIAGKGNEIFIFSVKGRLLDKLTVQGRLDCWRNPNSKMDVADLDNDGFKEIIAVTNEGRLYIFAMGRQ